MNFKSWFIIVESKEEKALALELAGNPSTLSSLSEVIPQGKKETDPLLLLAAYYYSKNKNVEQIKTDMRDYIGFLNNNRMPLITVDLISKEPPNPWKNYLSWTEAIHGQQGEDAAKKASSFRPSDIDFQNEVPFMTSPDGKIKVYKGHSPQQCIILGKGQTFCISQPGNRMWQSYRDKNVSTFYFVYDDTRDDRLSIVVVDVRGDGSVELTDKVNSTGNTLDPYRNQVTTNSDSYMKYLKEKGIDFKKLVNIPKSKKEEYEETKLGANKINLDWFISLTHDEKSKYIGRGHYLSNEQFDYLWENKFVSLLTQYVKTGLKLPDYQIDKIATNRDLKDNYMHNRLIANENKKNLTKKEFDLLKDDKKRELLNSIDNAIRFGSIKDVEDLIKKGAKIGEKEVYIAAKHGRLDIVKYLVEEKGAKIGDDAVFYAAKNGHLDVIKYLVEEKGAKIGEYAVGNAAESGNLDVIKYLVEKGGKIGDLAIYFAVEKGHFDIVKYLVEEKGAKIGEYAVENAAKNGHLDIVKYLVEKGAKIGDAVKIAVENGRLDIIKYFLEKNIVFVDELFGHAIIYGTLNVIKYLIDNKKVIIKDDAVSNAAAEGHLYIVKYLVEEKGAKIGDAVGHAVEKGHFNIVKYLVEKGAEIGNAVNYAAKNGHLDIVKYLVEEKGAEIGDAINYAASHGHLDIIKYLLGDEVELNGEKIKLPENISKGKIGNAVDMACRSGYLNIIRYFIDEKGVKFKTNTCASAIRYGHLDIVKYCVEEKGVEITNNLIDIAHLFNQKEIANYLKSEFRKRYER